MQLYGRCRVIVHTRGHTICVFKPRGHTDAVLCVQFDDQKVVSGSKDTSIKVR